MTAVENGPVKLSDPYERLEGEVLLSGLQALVRLPLAQRHLDQARGLDIGILISGYEGSPLAGYDLELGRRQSYLDQARVLLRPAVNEELGANAVQGSQLAAASKDCTADGVVGIWYGKAPGLDRASDAIRHGNLGGAAPNGGVLVLVGDDSIAKSSTVPSSSELAMAELGMPVLAPSDPQDTLELGLHGIAMSRFCGLWTGLKLATNVVDGAATTTLRDPQIEVAIPDNVVDGVAYHHEVSADFLQPNLATLEESLTEARPELALRYARANRLNQIIGDPEARVGVVAAGASYRDLRQALGQLGVDLEANGSGVRILKLGMVAPLDAQIVAAFADGLDELIVVEEKRAFIEVGIKDVLFGLPRRPRVTGRRSADGATQFRSHSDLPPELIAEMLAPILEDRQVAVNDKWRPRRPVLLPLLGDATRTPYFCSGCPHNRSTVVPEGSLVGAGIGCSGLAPLMNKDRVGEIVGFSQMGGEGAWWVGMSPFVSRPHLIQNMGDGTYHHSGSLAIRSAVAAGVRITYKVLYNGAVAMTGGQDAVGKMGVPQVAQELLTEGVMKVVVTTDDPGAYRRRSLPRGVKVRHRDDLLEVQRELAEVDGVTVIIHEQECATELRRKRKRGLATKPKVRAYINERVCEGCGDCGVKSNCLSVQPVDTELGRKTAIHQASCNQDFSCFDGDCPSFLSVVPGKPQRESGTAALEATDIPEPLLEAPTTDFSMRMTGIGGTGIVTAAQVIAVAAQMEGLHVRTLDQLGMAQKGGAVVSDLLLSTRPLVGANKVGVGACDLYLGADLLVAAAEGNLAVASPRRTVAVVSRSQVPTGKMVADPTATYPDADTAVDRVLEAARRADSVTLDARRASIALFGDDQFATVLLVGVAVQAGALPLPPARIEAALKLNGVAIETNIQAFRRGRQAVADRAAFDRLAQVPKRQMVATRTGEDLAARFLEKGPDTLRALVAARAGDLAQYQNSRYAERYVEAVAVVAKQEQSRLGSSGLVASGYAAGLYKLMAYKDEYEVARLSLDPVLLTRMRQEFGPGYRYAYRLHPPMLRALGMKRKLVLGPWFRGAFRLLYAARGLRGTPFDPFGYAQVRRVERHLVDEYRANVLQAMELVTEQNVSMVCELVETPDLVRGYEHIKLANVEKFRAELSRLSRSLRLAQPAQ